MEFNHAQYIESTTMTPAHRSWSIANAIMFVSAAMTIYGAFFRREPLWATWFNAILLILALLFQLWVSRKMLKRPKEATARDLATGFKPHPNYPNGIDMTDITRELAKDPPCRKAFSPRRLVAG